MKNKTYYIGDNLYNQCKWLPNVHSPLENARYKPCMSHINDKGYRLNHELTPDYDICFLHRVKCVSDEDAKTYLEWVNDNIYPVQFDESKLWFKPIYINGQYRYSNTVVVFMILRILWEGRQDIPFNHDVISSVANGEVNNFEEFLKMYEKYYDTSGHRLNGNHCLLSRSRYDDDEESGRFTHTNVTPEDLTTVVFQKANNFTRFIKQ